MERKKKALIVGACGTIGTAVVKRFSGEGVSCFTSSSRHGQADFFIDFTDYQTIVVSSKDIPALDCLVISSGREPQMSLAEMTLDHMETMIRIHLTGTIFLIKCLRPKLQDRASVVLISSAAAYHGSYDPVYSAAKGALISLTRTLARELSPQVRVNAVAPGLVEDSPVFYRMTAEFRQKHLQRSLTKKYVTMDECADCIYFLFNNQNITGQVIHVNGGSMFG